MSQQLETIQICVFEFDDGFPLRRHAAQQLYRSVNKNIKLVVRTIASVLNYDFLIEYDFFYDGSVEVSTRVSGYVDGAFWEDNPEYGFHIHEYLSGSLEQHITTFKADIDILGCKNSVQKVEFVPTSTTYPWSQGIKINTFKANRSFLDTESGIMWAPNDAAMYAIVNKDSPNQFGEFPGYRMKRTTPATAPAHQRTTFFITLQKDTEPRSSDGLNFDYTADPLVDFSKFVDGESIEQEDVVVWFNLGLNQMASSADLPNTMFTSTHSAMRFEPLNYLPYNPSLASNQQINVTFAEDGSVASVDEFGQVKGNVTSS